MSLDIEQTAFHEAGARALRLTAFYGEDPACEIMAGYVRAYMKAIGAVKGWLEVEKLYREVRPVPFVPKKLQVIQGGK